MFCEKCGNIIGDNANFCSVCGCRVSQISVEDGNQIEKWTKICHRISQGIQDIRKRWFLESVDIVKGLNRQLGDSDDVANPMLEGNAELALKAFQIFIITGILHRYVPSNRSKDFSDILFPNICGEALKECFVFFDRYMEVESDGGQQIFRISTDIARHITQDEAPLAAGLAIGSIYPRYYLETQMVVAEAFGDNETAKKLREGILGITTK